MENVIKTERVNTSITGTIQGQNVTINYENKLGELPANVTANCSIPDPNALPGQPGNSTNINISSSIMGNQNISINGSHAIGDINLLLSGMETAILAILSNPVV